MECLEKQNPATNNRPKKNMKNWKIKRSPSLTAYSPKQRALESLEESFSQKMQITSVARGNEQPLVSQCTPLKMTVFRKHINESGELTQLYDFQTESTTVRSKSKMKYILGDFNQIQRIGPYLLNVAPHSTNSYSKTQWKELTRLDESCNCNKTNCLQQYCSCYQSGGFCGGNCSCHNCKNTATALSKSEELIQIRRETKSRRNSKRLKEFTSNPNSEIQLFCRCKKTGCIKSYCICHRSGINCSKECGCFNCSN